jgi:hypothetical protein
VVSGHCAVVRAVLVLLAGLLWLGCLAGAVGFSGYSVWLAFRGRSTANAEQAGDRSLSRALAVVSAVYATLMAVFAAVLAVLVLNGPVPGSAADAVKWAAIPLWSAAAAATTSLLQQRRRRVEVPRVDGHRY